VLGLITLFVVVQFTTYVNQDSSEPSPGNAKALQSTHVDLTKELALELK
jgi:hypothetical protein